MKAYEYVVTSSTAFYKAIDDPLDAFEKGISPFYLVRNKGWGELSPNSSRFVALGVVRTYGANHSQLNRVKTNDEFPYDFLVEVGFGSEAFVRIWCADFQSYIRLHQEIHRTGEWKEWHA